jgi:hypothetical protein
MKRKLLSLDDPVIRLEAFDGSEQDVKDRIHELVMKQSEYDPDTDCQIFTGCWEQNGQAKMRVGAGVYTLSRIVAWLFHKDFKLWGKNRAVRTCDNPACCNGEHVVVVRNQAEAMSLLRRKGKV